MNRTHGVSHFTPDTCFGCHALTIQFSPPNFQPHYNHSVGRYVTNQREFNDALKALGDEQSERTGINSIYEPIHPADLANTPPPETPPSHLTPLSNISDPTLSSQVDALRRERATQSSTATRDSETKDLIPHGDS